MLELKPKAIPYENFLLNLALKPSLGLTLKVQEEDTIEEEVITEEEAKQNGLREDMDSIRLGSDVGWEIWVEPLNFILKEGSRNSYFSAFRPLLEVLHDRRIRFWLAKEKWNRIEVALEKAEKDIDVACDRVSKNVAFLNSKYGPFRIEI
jgi:hypothetical protein